MTIIREVPASNGRRAFWGEIAPCEHLVQLYEQEGAFLDSLEGFVADGISRGESVIAIATASHLQALDARLAARGIPVEQARAEDRYIPLDAADTLSRFMVRNWPDEGLFRTLVADLLKRARAGERRVRAFGEMVAIMWARGEHGATVNLEHLWHSLCKSEDFALFCAYPKSGFTQDAQSSIDQICASHSRVVPA
ncbi:MAG TPA: MEDS domain-containing protein [Verrucomicrobiae bacterium]|nr:MEDS domain-containing protein [Verrucomicrobiae bacterium]